MKVHYIVLENIGFLIQIIHYPSVLSIGKHFIWHVDFQSIYSYNNNIGSYQITFYSLFFFHSQPTQFRCTVNPCFKPQSLEVIYCHVLQKLSFPHESRLED